MNSLIKSKIKNKKIFNPFLKFSYFNFASPFPTNGKIGVDPVAWAEGSKYVSIWTEFNMSKIKTYRKEKPFDLSENKYNQQNKDFPTNNLRLSKLKEIKENKN